jgi:hypothetical protein
MPNKRLFIATILVVALALFLSLIPAFAQEQQCGPRSQVINHLNENYGEVPINVGVVNEAVVMETYANLETGTWTILASRTDGLTCFIASGQSFTQDGLHLPPNL